MGFYLSVKNWTGELARSDGAFGVMVGLRGSSIEQVPLEEIVGRPNNVALDCDTIATARDLGISLGD